MNSVNFEVCRFFFNRASSFFLTIALHKKSQRYRRHKVEWIVGTCPKETRATSNASEHFRVNILFRNAQHFSWFYLKYSFWGLFEGSKCSTYLKPSTIPRGLRFETCSLTKRLLRLYNNTALIRATSSRRYMLYITKMRIKHKTSHIYILPNLYLISWSSIYIRPCLSPSCDIPHIMVFYLYKTVLIPFLWHHRLGQDIAQTLRPLWIIPFCNLQRRGNVSMTI